MTRPLSKSQPRWTDVKKKLASFDRQGLLGVIQDLYEAQKENRTFLHARFELGGDVLKPYKEIIERWVWPDPLRNQYPSISKAKKAISDYRKAVGDPAGLAELLVFYCERAVNFCEDFGLNDGAYADGLATAFEQAAAATGRLPEELRQGLIERLEAVSDACQEFGYGIGRHTASVMAQLR